MPMHSRATTTDVELPRAQVTEAEREVKDLSSEFQREREDMLDTIRQRAPAPRDGRAAPTAPAGSRARSS